MILEQPGSTTCAKSRVLLAIMTAPVFLRGVRVFECVFNVLSRMSSRDHTFTCTVVQRTGGILVVPGNMADMIPQFVD